MSICYVTLRYVSPKLTVQKLNNWTQKVSHACRGSRKLCGNVIHIPHHNWALCPGKVHTCVRVTSTNKNKELPANERPH
jgi:hypothetical protein